MLDFIAGHGSSESHLRGGGTINILGLAKWGHNKYIFVVQHIELGQSSQSQESILEELPKPVFLDVFLN